MLVRYPRGEVEKKAGNWRLEFRRGLGRGYISAYRQHLDSGE